MPSLAVPGNTGERATSVGVSNPLEEGSTFRTTFKALRRGWLGGLIPENQGSKSGLKPIGSCRGIVLEPWNHLGEHPFFHFGWGGDIWFARCDFEVPGCFEFMGDSELAGEGDPLVEEEASSFENGRAMSWMVSEIDLEAEDDLFSCDR